jgi:hypothetical protein
MAALRTAIQQHHAHVVRDEAGPETFHDLVREAFAALDVP